MTDQLTYDDFRRRVLVQTLFGAAGIRRPMRLAPDVAEYGHGVFNNDTRGCMYNAGFTHFHDHLPLGRSPVGSMDIESRLYLADAGLEHICEYEAAARDWLGLRDNAHILAYYGSLDGERLAHLYETSLPRWRTTVHQCIDPAIDLAGPQFSVGIDSSTNDVDAKDEMSAEIRDAVEANGGEFIYESWPWRSRANPNQTFLANEADYQQRVAANTAAPISDVRSGIRMVVGKYEGSTHTEKVDYCARTIACILSDDPKWRVSIGLWPLIRDGRLTARRLYVSTMKYMGGA